LIIILNLLSLNTLTHSLIKLTMPLHPEDIEYSEKYYDSDYEYRHVLLNAAAYRALRVVGEGRLLTEDEWRHLGVQQSDGWEHYMVFDPEPWVLLFRRPLPLELQLT
jgi:cyclin-dependent kinase regulatory subunit CKS1